MKSLILVTATGLLLPLLLLFSLFLLARGHHEPGGGFAGGLVAAAAFTLYALARDPAATRRALGIEPRALIGLGLLVALLAGLLGPVSGEPFLTGRWVSLSIPGSGSLDLGSPLLFDIGVYLVVVGFALSIILTLAEATE